MANINVAIAGSTGLVGSHILKSLLNHPSVSTVHAFSRRTLDTSTLTSASNNTTSAGGGAGTDAGATPPSAAAKLHPIISTDTSTWPSSFPSSTRLNLYISALGTTRAAAGSLQAQRAIDVDLNVALARAAAAAAAGGATTSTTSTTANNDTAKAETNTATATATTADADADATADTNTEPKASVCVIVSAAGASAGSRFPYNDMKGTLEKEVSGMDFDKVVIVRPGLIVGDRAQESRAVEASFRALAKGLGAVSGGHLKDFWAQDADVIAAAAVTAGIMAVKGKAPTGEKVWVVDQKEILRLGKKKAACL